MGKKKSQNCKKRKKSSQSDSENHRTKQHKHGGQTGSLSEDNCDTELSKVLSAANSVLYSGSNSDENTPLLQGTTFDVFNTESTENTITRHISGAENTSQQDNMASAASDSQKLSAILDAVGELQKNQTAMQHMFESKLDQLKQDLMQNIDSRVSSLREELAIEIEGESRRIDDVMTTLQSMQTRLDAISDTTHENNGQRSTPEQSDDEHGIMVSGLPFSAGEDLSLKVKGMLDALGKDVSSAVHTAHITRFQSYNDKPGLVRVTFNNTEEKVLVLRNKLSLKDNATYSDVYLKSCRSRAERVVEQNMRAILSLLPNGRNYRIAANGRIQERTQR